MIYAVSTHLRTPQHKHKEAVQFVTTKPTKKLRKSKEFNVLLQEKTTKSQRFWYRNANLQDFLLIQKRQSPDKLGIVAQ